MSNSYSSSIAKVVTKVKFSDRNKDVDYWREQPYQARLDALEQIRQEYHHWKYDAEPGFQRVYRIIKRQ